MGRPDDTSSYNDPLMETHSGSQFEYQLEILENPLQDPQQQQQQQQQQQYQQLGQPPPPQYRQAPPPQYAQAPPPQYPLPPPTQIPQQYPPQTPQQYPPQQPQQYPPQQPQAQPNVYQQQTFAPSPLYVQTLPPQYQTHPGLPYKLVPQAVPGGPAQGHPMQPAPLQHLNPPGTQPWTTGILDCMDDPTNALITLCFPFVTFGQIAEIIDNGQTSCGSSGFMYGCISFMTGMPCLISCSYRTKLRSRYDLIESPAPDWATHFMCEYCALCQEYRELYNRGYDPAIGWNGNQIKARQQQQQQAATMTPPGNQMM
ncbi:hypothetical protein GIB67_000854 [Kingdonia uniflora]|uniref:Uncharacterized protein n=1 Tax=Kingdonia uniflora TaxID=39325 RepID=A0A7J7LFS0_9MAGN|nr:hypothetical protein GIB67_000854 [Kingdonia uniflora]